MKLYKLFSIGLVALTTLLSTPVFAQTAISRPGQAKAQVLNPQPINLHGNTIVGNLYACDPDNDHGSTAQFVVDLDGHAGLVPNLNVMENEGWNDVQAGINFTLPQGGIADGPNGTLLTFVWRPTHQTVSGCNQGLYLWDYNKNPTGFNGGFQTELYPPSIFNTTGPDANGYFTTTATFNPGFTILQFGLVATGGGNFNVKSFDFGGNSAVFPLPGGNHKRPTLDSSCPFGTDHGSINFDFYCGQ